LQFGEKLHPPEHEGTDVSGVDEQFQLPVIFDLAATFLFGTTGALVAVQRGYDYVGVFGLTLATAIGGGLIRDGIFLQNGPPVVVVSHRGYIWMVLIASIVGTRLGNHVERFRRTFLTFDALGMSAYGVVGVHASLKAGLDPIPAVVVGVINATGGGLLRDILTRQEPLLFKPGQYYVLPSLIGCSVLIILLLSLKVPRVAAGVMAMALTFLLRMIAVLFDLRSSPVAPGRAFSSEPPEKIA
jgi:uncharacterized membrane protein YeiH